MWLLRKKYKSSNIISGDVGGCERQVCEIEYALKWDDLDVWL